jgi:hypothetical protein
LKKALDNNFFVNEYEFYCKKKIEEQKYYFLDLSSLHSYVKKDPQLFLSDSFSNDFFPQLRSISGEGAEVLSFGHGQYLLKASKKDLAVNLGKFLETFRFWSYFDDKEEHFSRVIDPNIYQLTKNQVKSLLFEKKKEKSEIRSNETLKEHEV